MAFEDILSWLSGNTILNIVFLILSISSIAVSIYLFFKSIRSKKPVYLEINYPLIEDSVSAIDGLEIKYNKQKISRLTLTRFSFWNNGRETIDGNDIAAADRLRIYIPARRKTDSGEMISAKVIFSRKQANSIKLDIEDSEAYISFDFLDYGDGAIFEIYHTGIAEHQLGIKGTLKGSHKLKRGAYKKGYLFAKVDRFLSDWLPLPALPSPDEIQGSILKGIIVMFMFPITFIIYFPFIVIVSPIDYIATYFYKIPKEYDLSSVSMPYKELDSGADQGD